jgi:hypothetical protein
MLITFEFQLFNQIISTAQNHQKLHPNMVRTVIIIYLFLFGLYAIISQTSSISKNEETQSSSTYCYTYSILLFQKTNISFRVASNQGKNDNIIFFSLVVIDGRN